MLTDSGTMQRDTSPSLHLPLFLTGKSVLTHVATGSLCHRVQAACSPVGPLQAAGRVASVLASQDAMSQLQVGTTGTAGKPVGALTQHTAL